jgi:hypothetical protein
MNWSLWMPKRSGRGNVWAIQEYLWELCLITAVQGGRRYNTCPEPMGIENSKNGLFQGLNQWEMWKLCDLREVNSSQWHTLFMWMSVLTQGSAATGGQDYFLLGECLQPSFFQKWIKSFHSQLIDATYAWHIQQPLHMWKNAYWRNKSLHWHKD